MSNNSTTNLSLPKNSCILRIDLLNYLKIPENNINFYIGNTLKVTVKKSDKSYSGNTLKIWHNENKNEKYRKKRMKKKIPESIP